MKILTFNTGLLELSVGKFSFDVVPLVEERAQVLPRSLREVDADVVCLQEIFRLEDMDILKTLHDVYPYMYFSDHKNILKRSGLAMFSKYPFTHGKEIRYKTAGVEKLVRKGAIRIQITDGPYADIEVVNTHFPYGGFGVSSQTMLHTIKMRNKNIEKLHKHIFSEHKTVIVAGDFNFGPTVAPANFHKMEYLGYQGVSNGDITWDVENPLNLMFPTSVSKSIDHIFINQKRDFEFSIIESTRVFDTTIQIGEESTFLSDHFGLLCEVEL